MQNIYNRTRQWRSQHKLFGGDAKRATMFYLEYRLLKHKITRYTNLGRPMGRWDPWLRQCNKTHILEIIFVSLPQALASGVY